MSYCWDCMYDYLPVNLEPCKSCDELIRNKFKKALDGEKPANIYLELITNL